MAGGVARKMARKSRAAWETHCIIRGRFGMRTFLIALAAVGGITAATSTSTGAPANGGGLGPAVHADPLVQDARVFCYNRYTGRFLHWGYCGYRPIVYRRVYCVNRFTGRFIHWGSCWR